MMDLIISKALFGIRPNVTLPDRRFYQILKEDGIRELVSSHYNMLVVSAIKHLFPTNPNELAQAKRNAADFFIQICGGHPYYHVNRGQPMMVKRHSNFTITAEDRVVWLECYRELLVKMELPDQVLLSFWNYLNVFSIWMVNTPNRP